MYFCDRFYFEYLNLKNNITNSIKTQKTDSDAVDILRKAHGVFLKTINFNNKQILNDFLVELLSENNPVIVYSNVYYCPWSPYYKKIEIPHCFVLTKYESNSFIGIDSYFTDSFVKMNQDDFHFSQNMVTILEFSHPVANNRRFKFEKLLQGILNYDFPVSRKCSENFAHSLKNMNFVDELKKGDKIDHMPLLWKIRELEFNRRCYLELIDQMESNEFIDFQYIVKILDVIINAWLRLRLVIAKCATRYSMKGKEDAIAEMVLDIFEKEDRLIKAIKGLLEFHLA